MQPARPSIGHERGPGVLVERVAWAFGLACLVTCGAVYTDGAAGARHDSRAVCAPPGGTTLKGDIDAFVFGQQGLLAGLGIQITKITKIAPK